MSIHIRPISKDETDEFLTRFVLSFGGDYDAGYAARLTEIIDFERTQVAFEEGEIVGTCATHTLDLSVPGGARLPLGGTTLVSVLPTHRRRGISRALMQAHFADIEAHDEPLAGLWASEAAIYGRYGYGVAAEGHVLECNASRLHFRGDAPPGRVRLVQAEEGQALARAVYERARGQVAGLVSRSEPWWRLRALGESPRDKDGRSGRRVVVYEADGEARGYLVYQQHERWDPLPNGTTHIIELLALEDAAHEALWRYLADIDLFPDIRWWNAPVDDPLAWRITDRRALMRQQWDTLWLRILDVPRALSARGFGADGSLTIAVDDPFTPHAGGTFALDARGGRGQCVRADGEPDLALGSAALASLYLGAFSATFLARGGQIHGERAALERADALFANERAPWCAEIF